MRCEQCEKQEATVEFTHIVESEKRTSRLCSTCASKIQGVENEIPVENAQPKKVSAKSPTPEDLSTVASCPSCGASYDDFKKSGRLSCPECYIAFQTQVDRLLHRLHGAVQHCGKSKVLPKDPSDPSDELETLKVELDAAIAEEAFERAAQLRDRIKQVENELEDGADQTTAEPRPV
jgi:protein arginine kinase activator